MVDGGLTPLVAFAAGLLSFFAPCILPVVPAYISFISGGTDAARRTRVVRTLAFVLGFTLAFVALGVLAGALGSSGVLGANEEWFRRVGGLLIIAFGLMMTGLLRVPWLDRDLRYHGAFGKHVHPTIAPVLLGAAFGIGWSPCVGPVLASILILAGAEGGALAGGFLLFVYAMGLAIPFLLAGLLADRGVGLLRRFGRAARYLEIGGGVVLILLGIVVFTGDVVRLTSYILPGGPNA